MNSIDSEREEPGRRTPYMTRKDMGYVLLILLAGFVVYYFAFYIPNKNRRDYVVSQGNLKQLHQTLIAYADQNDDGLPAVFEMGAGGKVSLDRFGRPITWATLSGAHYLSPDLLKNPKNHPDWDTLITWGKDPNRAVNLSYGMLAPLGLQRRYSIKEPNIVILLAETIGGGRAHSLDPIPLDVPERRDGFIIGYNDNNLSPTRNSEYVTRLAFTAPASDTPLSARQPVHPGRNTLAITVSGSLVQLSAEDMAVEKIGNAPTGKWAPFR